MFFRRLLLLSSIVAAATTPSAGDDLYGPVLGIIADLPGSALRPIRGFPGAATIGDPVDLGPALTGISVTPRQSAALLATASGMQMAVLQPDGTVGATDAGFPSGVRATRVAFSPSGSVAAISDSNSGGLWIRASSVSAVNTSQLSGAIDLLAVSDGTAPLLAGALSGNRQSVFVLDGAGHYRVISGFSEISDLTFLGTGRDLAIADSGARQIFIVRDPLSGNAPETLLDFSDAQGRAISVASSADGAMVAVMAAAKHGAPARTAAGAQQRAAVEPSAIIGLVRVADRRWDRLECDCASTALTALRGNAVFRLTHRIDQPLWILDGDSAPARLLFIPAVQK